MSEVVKVTFDVNNIIARESVRSLLKVGAYTSALNDIYNKARGILKHGDTTNEEYVVKTLEEIRSLAAIYFDDED